MQEWLGNNDILMYSTQVSNCWKKSKIYEKVTVHLPYLNNLVDQDNNTYHSINKKPINADYSALTEKMWPVLKLLNLNWMIKLESPSIRMF